MQGSPTFWRFLLPFRRKRKALNRPGQAEPPGSAEVLRGEAAHRPDARAGDERSSEDILKETADAVSKNRNPKTRNRS